MCGIAGYFGPQPAEHESTVRAMTAALTHRGPDAEGLWTGPSCVLGHRRLKVLDLSEHAAQPMALEDGSVCIAYNGEVYNFKELRTDLEALGHRFVSTGDTEVLLRGWRQWGEGLPERLDGMFAFAIHDASDGSMTLVRDRVGIKPLYYAKIDSGFFFASELRALMGAPVAPILSAPAVEAFFYFQQIPAPLSVFRDANKLLPGQMLRVSADGSVDSRFYGTLPETSRAELTDEQALTGLEESLDAAVRKRLVADVPLGAFLSGGVDSSLIAALMARHAPEVRTFSIGYKETEYDETRYAQAVADHIGTQHTCFVVESDAASMVRELCAHWGEPFGDSSAIPTYYVSQQTREHVTVALSGDGGDESMLGYHRHRAELRNRWLLRLPQSILLGALGAGFVIPGPTRRWALGAKPFLVQDDVERYLSRVLYFSRSETEQLFARSFANRCTGTAMQAAWKLLKSGPEPFAQRMADYETGFYLPGVILNKTDSMSMLHSLEVRVPFCDHRLMEYVRGLPLRMKYRNGIEKYLLKKLAERYIPRECIYRKKMGFTAPIRLWMQRELGSLLRESLEEQRQKLSQVIDCDYALKLLDDHQAARANHARKLWLVLVFALWSAEHRWEVAA